MAPLLRQYRAYMRRRRYAAETIWARASVARDWLRRGDWRSATFADVERWLAERDVSPASERNLITNLRAFYRWAMREGLTDRDPTLLVDRPRMPRRLPRPARDDHIAEVLAGADAQLAAMIALMACAGLRCVEISRLDWCDVDLEQGRIVVMGKGMKERSLELAADVVRMLAELEGVAGPVFTGARGGRLSPARVSQRVCKAFHDAGYATVAHQLRHRCATTALRLDGVDILVVRDLLGHASVSTTQIYTAVVPGRVATVLRMLDLPGPDAA
jgi:site-specific recombinase XerD